VFVFLLHTKLSCGECTADPKNEKREEPGGDNRTSVDMSDSIWRPRVRHSMVDSWLCVSGGRGWGAAVCDMRDRSAGVMAVLLQMTETRPLIALLCRSCVLPQ
jgi:hypothetical protein